MGKKPRTFYVGESEKETHKSSPETNIELVTVYVFITDEDKHPEDVGDRKETWWSCSKTARENNIALVYVKGIGIVYQWLITSDARPHPEWRYVCDIEHQQTFDRAISLEEIRSVVDSETWAPPHQNFRGFTSLVVPIEAASRIYKLRGK